MKKIDALTLKPGDLVVIQKNRNSHLDGMVLEIESIDRVDIWACWVTLKQPGYDEGWRLKDYDSRRLERYEK